MDVSIINSIEQLKEYRKEWDQILSDNRNDIPFIELDWIIKWWEVFGEGRQLFVIMLKEKHDLIGFYPLMAAKRRFYIEVSHIGYPKATYMDLVVPYRYRREALEAIAIYLTSLKGKYLFVLHGLFENQDILNIMVKLLKDKNIQFFRYTKESRYISFGSSNFSEYFASRSGKHSSIKNIDRQERGLSRLGKVEFTVLNDDDIDILFELHNKRWKKKNDTSGLSNGVVRRLYKELAVCPHSGYKVVVYSLKLNSKAIAIMYIFICRRRIIFVRIAHDDDYARYGPGKILLKETIKKSMENGLSILDFGTGHERYKSEWTDSSVMVNTLVFTCGGLITKIIYAKCYIENELKRIAKGNRGIVNFKRNTLGKIRYYLSGQYWFSAYDTTLKAIRQAGIITLLRFRIKKLVNRFYTCEELNIYRSTLDGKAKLLFENDDHYYMFEEITVDSLSNIHDILFENVREVLKRFEKKHRCFVLKYRGEVANYCWVAPAEIYIPGRGFSSIKADKDNMYMYLQHVSKKHKENTAFMAMVSYLSNRLSEEGLSKVNVLLNKNDVAKAQILNTLLFSEEKSIILSGFGKKIKTVLIDKGCGNNEILYKESY